MEDWKEIMDMHPAPSFMEESDESFIFTREQPCDTDEIDWSEVLREEPGLLSVWDFFSNHCDLADIFNIYEGMVNEMKEMIEETKRENYGEEE